MHKDHTITISEYTLWSITGKEADISDGGIDDNTPPYCHTCYKELTWDECPFTPFEADEIISNV